MRKFVWLIAVVLCSVATAAAETEPPRTLTVNGEGVVEAEPDMAVVHLGASFDDLSAAKAYERSNRVMQQVLAAIEKAGVVEADIKTAELTLMPKIEYGPAGSKQTGFTMTHRLSVKVRDLSRLAEVIDDAAQAGANKIAGVSFGFKDADSLMSEARSKAMEVARDRAEDLADDAGVKLGKIMSVSENTFSLPYSDYASFEGRAGGELPVMTGSQPVRVTVYVAYYLQ